MKERITVLLGAGAMIEAAGVSTKTLTEKVILQCKEFKIDKSSDISIVDLICDRFLDMYKNNVKELPEGNTHLEKITNIITFEDIFHVLELLPNYKNSFGYKGHASAFQIFSELNKDFKNLDLDSVYYATRTIINIINDEVYNYDFNFATKGTLFKTFFEEIINSKDYALDVFNLNYDTWVEQTLIDFNDGYVDISGYEDRMKRFNITEYLKEDDKHTISHLHGQIYFEYPKFNEGDENKFAFKESYNTLYKYKDFNLAKKYRKQTWRSSDCTQSGENLFRTNIITGLMKTDKLLWNPLNVYHNKLMDCLSKNKKLIIVGYGFFDLYINNLLYQYNSIHFDDRKMLMIDYISDNEWVTEVEHPFKPSDKAIFTGLMHKEDYWYMNLKFKPREDINISSDNMVCICNRGFNNVCNNHMKEIKDFLK